MRQDLEALCHRASPPSTSGACAPATAAWRCLHGIDLVVGKGQSLCLIGPNGAGKSTVLHAVFGFADVMAGSIHVGGRDVTRLASSRRLADAGVAYVLQGQLRLPRHDGGGKPAHGGLPARPAGGPRSRQRRARVSTATRGLPSAATAGPACSRAASAGSWKSRARSSWSPRCYWWTSPSIGLEPRFIDMVFEILADLQRRDGKTIVMVEQNAKKGLEFADIGYVLVSGRLAMTAPGDALLEDPEVGLAFSSARETA